MLRRSIIVLLLFLPFLSVGKKKPNCAQIENGRFYYYHAQKSYLIIRHGITQIEIDLASGDTSLMEAKWITACILNLKTVRTTEKMPLKEELFIKAHSVNVEILKVTNKYYTFKGAGVDPSLSKYVIEDTIWFNPKKTFEIKPSLAQVCRVGNECRVLVPLRILLPLR